MKKCTLCQEVKPLLDFGLRADRPNDARQSRCKRCLASAAAARRAANPERVRQIQEKHRRAHSEPLLAKAREYKRAHKERLAQARAEYLADPDVSVAAKAKRAAYVAANLGKFRRYRAERRAAQAKATPAWADRDDTRMWFEVAEVLSRGGVEFHVDHVVPLRSKTVCGLHVPANLTVLPHHLNHAKGNRHWPDMP